MELVLLQCLIVLFISHSRKLKDQVLGIATDPLHLKRFPVHPRHQDLPST